MAWRINSLGVSFHNTMRGGRFSNAKNWDDNAKALGWQVSSAPRKHAIAVSNSGTYGHVAFVESVNGDGSVNISESNIRGDGRVGTRTGARFDAYVYVPGLTAKPATSSVSRYAKTIVKKNGDPTTSWFVTPDLKRLWIRDGGTYLELLARGYEGPYSLDSATLDQLPDQSGKWVATGSVWKANSTLRRGMSVLSQDGRYKLALQGDGNLVLYGPSGRALWATSWKTGNWQQQRYVVFQSDGNLVTYADSGKPIWHTGTHGTKADRFVIQTDGNMVIYRGSKPVWASGTAGRR